MNKLILLSGPSCVGKSPLLQAFHRIFPDLARSLEKVVLYNDRPPRPGEQDGIDYYFRSRAEIETLGKSKDFLLIQVRNDLQALELASIQRILDLGKHAFYEGATYVVSQIIEHKIAERIPIQTIFLSPLNREEIQFLCEPARHVDIQAVVIDVMRKKLLRRKQKQMGWISLPDLEDIEIRCRSAYAEMRQAFQYQYVIPNHDGEDSEDWNAFPWPIGDALQSVLDLASILNSNPRNRIERWERDLLPEEKNFSPR